MVKQRFYSTALVAGLTEVIPECKPHSNRNSKTLWIVSI